MLDFFEYTTIDFFIRFKEDFKFKLPKNYILKYNLGNILKKELCINPKSECHSCFNKSKCPFTYLFSTAIEINAGFKKVSPPYMILSESSNQSKYKKGERMKFSIRLFGKALNYYNTFINAFYKIGEEGILHGKGKFSIVYVSCSSNSKILSNDGHIIEENFSTSHFKDGLQSTNSILIDFETPFVSDFNDLNKVEFFDIVSELFFRLNELFKYHQNYNIDMPLGKLLERSKSISTIDKELFEVEYQNSRAIKGHMIFHGDLTDFLPFLRLGEIFHIGLGTNVGMGKFKLYRF